MSRQYTGTSVRFNANMAGTANALMPTLASPHGALRIFPCAAQADGYTRVAFGSSTVAVPTLEQAAFTVSNNRETIIVPPTGTTYMAAWGNATIIMDVMLDLPDPTPIT